MQLLSQVLGALAAGVLVLVVARQAGFEHRRAVGAVALVPIAVAAFLAAPAVRDGVHEFRERHRVNAPLTAEQAEQQPGVAVGVDVAFLDWAEERLPDGDTFHLVIGSAPDEAFVAGVGTRQATILQWSLFQLAPHLAIEQSDKARDLRPGEGRDADWIVLYEYDPADYRGVPLGEVVSYAPGFAIGRVEHAG